MHLCKYNERPQTISQFVLHCLFAVWNVAFAIFCDDKLCQITDIADETQSNFLTRPG
jgi:hypothetical protein